MTSKWIIKQIVNGKSVESSTEQAKFRFNLIIIMWTIKQAEETFRNRIPWKFNFYWVINSAELPDELFPHRSPLLSASTVDLTLGSLEKGFSLCFSAWVDQDDLHNDKRRLMFRSAKNLNVTDSWILFYNRRSMFLQLGWALHNLCRKTQAPAPGTYGKTAFGKQLFYFRLHSRCKILIKGTVWRIRCLWRAPRGTKESWP